MSSDPLRILRAVTQTVSTPGDVRTQRAAPSMPTAKREPPEPAAMTEAVKASARQIESFLRSSGRELEFRVDDDSGMTVVSVRDPQTGDLIRQIPGEEVLRIARALDNATPHLFETKV